MKQINNWDKIKEAGGAIENLPAGGYICDIKSCVEKPNRNNGGTHLEILFDVLSGDYRGFFEQDYRQQDREEKFWRGIINQNVPDEGSQKYEMQCRFFKKFINEIEASNDGYHWDWNETGLKGKKIGIIFGMVEREGRNGNRYMISRADSVINVEAIEKGNYKIPDCKMLSPAKPSTNAQMPFEDGDLPF